MLAGTDLVYTFPATLRISVLVTPYVTIYDRRRRVSSLSFARPSIAGRAAEECLGVIEMDNQFRDCLVDFVTSFLPGGYAYALLDDRVCALNMIHAPDQ